MAKFFYAARDTSGRKREGVIDAESNSAVVVALRRQALLPVDIQAVAERAAATAPSRGPGRGRVSLAEMALFSRQLSTMLDAGLPIMDSLGDLSTQTLNRYFSRVLLNVKEDIRQGSGLSQALAKYPKVFSPLYVALVRSGEESGNLVEVLTELSGELEEQLTLIRKVRQAMSYPLVILVFFVGVVIFVFFFLIPKFQEIFSSFGAQLPVFTKIILNISRAAVKFSPFLAAFVVIFAGFMAWYGRTRTGRKQIDTLKLKFPIFGTLFLKVGLARLSRSLATLLRGGVTITAALEIVAKTAGNVILEGTVEKLRRGVVKGELLGTEMKKHKIFPPMLVRMVSVGEETGRTDDMLARMSRFFRDEVDTTLNILASIIEPIMIIGLGAVVGIVVLAIYLPIFKLAATMR